MITAALGIALGCLAAIGVVSGKLRFLAVHKWIYDVVDVGRKGGIVTAYVMTTIVEDSKVLMYRDRIHEIFLSSDGKISYVILKNCARFYMALGSEALTTSKQLELFGANQSARATWDYLLIEGENIANILFDPSHVTIRTTDKGQARLRGEVLKRKQAARKR